MTMITWIDLTWEDLRESRIEWLLVILLVALESINQVSEAKEINIEP